MSLEDPNYSWPLTLLIPFPACPGNVFILLLCSLFHFLYIAFWCWDHHCSGLPNKSAHFSAFKTAALKGPYRPPSFPVPFRAASQEITPTSSLNKPNSACLKSRVCTWLFSFLIPCKILNLFHSCYSQGYHWLPHPLNSSFLQVNGRSRCSSPLVDSDGERGGQQPCSDQTTAGQLLWHGICAENSRWWSVNSSSKID